MRYVVYPSALCWVIGIVGFFFFLIGPLIFLAPNGMRGTVQRAVGSCLAMRAMKSSRDRFDLRPLHKRENSMRNVCFAVLLTAFVTACGKSPPTDGASSGGGNGAAAQDYETYTKALKEKVTFDVKQFTASGMKAESYVKDTQSESMFKELTIKVDPVVLTDKITGKSALYTCAKLTRNNPQPALMNQSGGFASYPEPYDWAKVEMLP